MTPQRLTNSQRSARPARQPQTADKKTVLRRAQAGDKEQVLRRARAALSAPALASPADVMALQAVGGNRAVQRLLASAAPVGRDAAGKSAGGAPAGGSLAGGPLPSQSEAMLRQSRGGGQRLDPQVSQSIGAAMGADFSAVRVHTDARADHLNRSLNARAFTLGGNIYFRRGQYNPASDSGRHLLAHELTHVTQQGGGQPALQTSLAVGPAGDRYEQEADAVANNVMRRLSQPKANRPDGDEAAGPQAGQSARPLAVSRALAEPRLQRAMGWEFETPYVIEKEQGGQLVTLSKMDVIKDYGEGLKMTADTTSQGSSVIEMVLDPPVQEDQPERMTKSLEKFTKIGKGLDGIRLRGNQQAAPQKLSKVSGVDGPSKYQVTPTAGGFTGNPQITGGVRFDKLYEFLTASVDQAKPADTHSRAKGELSQQLGGGQKDAVSLTGAGAEVDKVNGTAELKGMVALLGMYLRYGASGPGKDMFNYAKLLGDTFMARTDFGAMFRKLPNSDYETYIKAPETFVTLALAAAGLSGTEGTKVYERGIRKSYDKASPDYKVDLTNQIAELGITRRSWLLGITLGEDRISSSGMPQLKGELEGLGALGSRTDRVGSEVIPGQKKQPAGGTGIILEMRKLKVSQLYTDFVASAQRIFEYLVAQNE